jgi:NhaA family Na+:H+ antiporter
VWANTAHASYERLAHVVHFAVNDVGMTFFFALATKEVVEATAPGGALHTWRRAALPVVAAAGGMVGPALGILSSVALSMWAGFHLPKHVDWRDLVVVGCAAGIGFTVALFFATAAFPPGPLLDQAKLGALLSVSSAGLAFVAAAALGVGRFRVSAATPDP